MEIGAYAVVDVVLAGRRTIRKMNRRKTYLHDVCNYGAGDNADSGDGNGGTADHLIGITPQTVATRKTDNRSVGRSEHTVDPMPAPLASISLPILLRYQPVDRGRLLPNPGSLQSVCCSDTCTQI
jgi:hypothetical protein